MNHIPEYIFAISTSVLLIGSLFVFHRFWAKTTKTIWVRLVIFAWILASQIWFYVHEQIFNSSIPETFMYWELCNIVTWSTLFLMIMPSKFQVDIFMPLAIIGPLLTIVVPTEESTAFGFNTFRYYNYYFGHLGALFGYLYIYLFDYTGARLNWQSMRRTTIFSFGLLTFVMVWNMAYLPETSNPLKPLPEEADLASYWGPNYIYRDIIYNLGLGNLSLITQYLLMIFIFGPMVLIWGWTAMFFARPIYANHGTEKLKFNIKEDILSIKTTFTKDNFKMIAEIIKQKIRP
ncbi:hypothetical protein ESOMN_v1c05280 [Williamsoniiplasma somnilux]|uniref:Uncharacterized protein n=1 Tax=Williamsoniiplasma somnilux TaxID=215578 RepID=A0A2K8NYL6_9MOLU|nr:YwaF family protein [Williamsoniiplasma somnilux]ATZ18910.1 hypothetical protein ESOMN_v1c05280 [Williamsoniiplasma somnilux]